MIEVFNLTKMCLFRIWLNIAVFHMDLVFGVGYHFVCFSNHPGINVSCFFHSPIHVFALLGALYSSPEVWRPLQALLNVNRSCLIFQIFILICFCSNECLNAWHIAPDAFTIVDTLNDMSCQHLCDTLQLLKLGFFLFSLGSR